MSTFVVDNQARIKAGPELRVSHVFPNDLGGDELLFTFTAEGVIIDLIPPMSVTDSGGATIGMTYAEFAYWIEAQGG